MLALGIWLGGHPQFLVDPVADVLVGPEERRITLEALDTIHDKYYREVDRGKLSDAALAGAVKDLDDRFSAYLSPKEYGQFEQSLDNAFSGVGTAIARASRTACGSSPSTRARRRSGPACATATSSRTPTAASSPASPRRPRPRSSRAPRARP